MDLLECIKTRLEELQTQKAQQTEILKAAAHYLQTKAQYGNECAISHPEQLIKAAETFLTLSKNQGFFYMLQNHGLNTHISFSMTVGLMIVEEPLQHPQGFLQNIWKLF